MAAIKIVSFLCDAEGRHPVDEKIAKIVNWPSCENLHQARGFMGICTYYRVWVEGFSIVAEPIFRLFRAGQEFVWIQEQEDAMTALKTALTTAPALVRIDYATGAGEIILAVDSSGRGWGAHLMQLDSKGRRRPCRFESGLWLKQERKYDAGKLECRGLLHALKKFRVWLYGAKFTVETDANTLVAQLNRAASDLPGALLTRWLA